MSNSEFTKRHFVRLELYISRARYEYLMGFFEYNGAHGEDEDLYPFFSYLLDCVDDDYCDPTDKDLMRLLMERYSFLRREERFSYNAIE